MTDRFQSRLSEYLDGDLTADEGGLVEHHLEGCDECAAIVDDLRAVRARAATLSERRPADDLWRGIESRIRAGSGKPRARAPRKVGRRIAMTVPQLAAAALTLASLSAAGAWLTLRGSTAPATDASESTPSAAVLAADGVVRSGAERYADAIADLEAALFDSDTPLPPETETRIRRALTTIDRAIEDARQALRAAPGDPYLRQHVSETMRRKAEFLRNTVRLAQS